MNLKITFLLAVLLAPLPSRGDELRPMIYHYQVGAGRVLPVDNQFVFCRQCPERNAAPAPYVPPPAPAPVPPSAVPTSPPFAPLSSATVKQAPEERRGGCRLAVVRFALKSRRLSPSARAVLDAAAARIKQQRLGPVTVEGYTCRLGGQSYNDRLALGRAREVARYLRGAGIEVASLSGTGRCCYADPGNLPVNRRSVVVGGCPEKEKTDETGN